MVFVNHYKDSPHTWSAFSNMKAAREYMAERGGVFTHREGNSFDFAWVDEEKRSRLRDQQLSTKGHESQSIAEYARKHNKAGQRRWFGI